jgi:hypothetical protein
MFSREQELLRKLLYQFAAPYVVDHSRFSERFSFEPTPHVKALHKTVAWCRMLNEQTRQSARS